MQLREKHLADDELVAVANAARALCERLGALLIVNDRPRVAREAGADGVHVGQDDMPVAEVRELVGPDMLIGLSTHAPRGDRRGRRRRSSTTSASARSTRRPPSPAARPSALELVRYAAAHAPVPFFAIGGLDAGNLAEALDAGASARVRAARDRRRRGPRARGARAARAARRAPPRSLS